MRRTILLAPLLIVMGPHDAAWAQQICSSAAPEVGTLVLDPGVRVTAYRQGRSITLALNSTVCAGDLIVASTAGGAVRRPQQESLPLLPRHDLLVPDRRSAILELLRIAAGRLRLFDAKPRATIAGSLGPEAPGFAFAGLRDGTADLATGTDVLAVPITPQPVVMSVELWPPSAVAPLRTEVLPGGGEARFNRLPRAVGRWLLVLDTGFSRLQGSFSIGGSRPDPTVETLGLPSRERSLALACLDPAKRSFEAYQTTSSADRGLLLSWESGDARFLCAIPGSG